MRSIVLIISIVLLASCSEYARVTKKGTVDEKYTMAIKQFKAKDYVRAMPLFEELLAYYRGKEKAEELYFYFSYCNYYLGQFELAAFHFKTFTETYYNSKHSEECYYMYAHCLYKDALPYYLDQSSTTKAITEMQLFLNLYPTSIYKELGNEQIEELRKNLKQKALETALLFFKIEDYRAATVSFKNAIKDFPDIENKDYIEFMVIKANYLYAKYSIDEKKVERLNDVFKAYKEFSGKYPNTNKYFKEAKELNEKASKELTNHNLKNKIQ